MADGIVIHHSATRDGITNNWETIRRYHTQTRGWQDIGYHFGIEQIGGRFQIMSGRAMQMPGAHTVGHNLCLGICLVGNYEQETPHPDALALLLRLVLGLLITHDLTPAQVLVHSDLAKTACPGRNFPRREFMAKLKSAWERMGGGRYADD